MLTALVAIPTFSTGAVLVLEARAPALVVAGVAVVLRAPFLLVVGSAAVTAAVVRAVT